ncbi:MAG: hypothetical protein Q9M15_01325 [Mariprofundaceae bacterium]|nr:hypothetical protein [Mariprofundaceae bacterium]
MALLIGGYFLNLPKDQLQPSVTSVPNGIESFRLSLQGRLRYHLTAQQALEKSLSLGMMHSTFLNYFLLNHIVFCATLEKFGEVYFYVDDGEMDVSMERLRLKYSVSVLSKNKLLKGVFRHVNVNLKSGLVSIKGGTWSYRGRQYRVIKEDWYLEKFQHL